ncbi:ShlB/FhaC/HecB family hemolysin secretion/activation protein [Helicobacter sp. 11S03491-1]|uniref:ShlB/FhaC/HecB family hemolysin secretion/activation protein n=1 Tax=Helicobacter sp. 11S03491-1 TaxID=1476196 RepID=UPI000BA669CF|nr:ShlB/FhaC/HecB family hemolysin secretion/activation protein [Helicobacter sp. 11S03491-1]PAF42920.1 hypothetical protein BKH45_02305 [Helicobacter sp. 11S03491-1]
MKFFWFFLIVLKVLWASNTNSELQNQNRILDLLEKQKEQNYIQEQLQYPDKYKSDDQGEIKEFEDNKEYIFSHISIQSQIKIPKTLIKMLANYQNKPLKKQDIFEIIKKTSEYYIKKGYTTTLVTIKSGNVKTGKLVLEVKLGYINHIEIKNSKYSNIRVFDAFPIGKNDILDIYALDQGIENLNNGGYYYQMRVEPSQKLDYSNILIEEFKTPGGISIGFNNSSTIDKGSFRSVLGLNQYNLLGINDTLSLNYMERFIHRRNKNKESIYSANYTLPFRYWKFLYSASYTDSYTDIQAQFGSYSNKSENLRNTFKIQRVLHRNKTAKTTVYAELKLRGQKNKINEVLIEINSKKYTALGIGIEHVNKLFGGNLYLDIEYLRGVPFFGGYKDTKNSIFKAQYNKLNLSASWQKYLYYGNYVALMYRLNVGASYSGDELYYADKFFIGDQYTVRGFKESSLALDKGGYISQTITLKPVYLQGSIWNLEPFFGLDYGGGRDYGLSHNDHIAGVAFGVNYFWKIISLGVTISQPLMRSKDMPAEFVPIYFNLNIFM